MATCKKIRRVDKRVCIGSLNKRIFLNVRTITTPISGAVDFGEAFTEEKEVWANVVTKTGTVFFDETNTAQTISHDIYIRYLPNITAETWVRFPSPDSLSDVRLDIIQVENLNEENKFYRLRCNIRGNVAKLTNYSGI